MFEVSINTDTQNDLLYKEINASFGADSLLYNTLSERLQLSTLSEAALMEWARFVKLASKEAVTISELEEFAVIKILRSWKSIEGLIHSSKQAQA